MNFSKLRSCPDGGAPPLHSWVFVVLVLFSTLAEQNKARGQKSKTTQLHQNLLPALFMQTLSTVWNSRGSEASFTLLFLEEKEDGSLRNKIQVTCCIHVAQVAKNNLL